MCAISGWVGEGVRADVVRRMTRSMIHRGPDAEQVVVRSNAALGVRRLVVRGERFGAQPMPVPGRAAWLAFNGEIYNCDDLRAELGADEFKGRCDTEVVARGYGALGKSIIERLNGTFALAVWDEDAQRLLLARDPMGRLPLYVAEVTGGLVFASEPRALLCHPEVSTSLDLGGVRSYLAHGSALSPRTVFRDIRQLEPGEWAEWRANQPLSRGFYWTPRFIEPPRGDHNVAAAFEDALRRATRRRLRADRPVGTLLSGGLDSSLVTALVAETQSAPAFTLGWDAPRFDESAHAAELAGNLGVSQHVMQVNDRLVAETVPQIVDHLDVPIADESVVPTWLISRYARPHVTVALTGDGADELFLGYSTFAAEVAARGMHRVGLHRLGGLVRTLAGAAPRGSGQLPLDVVLQTFAAGFDAPAATRHLTWLAPVSPASQGGLLSREVRAETAGRRPFGGPKRYLDAVRGRARDEWDVLCALYLRFFLGEMVLRKVDRPSMAHALELRTPFLDPEVVSLGLSLRVGQKRRGLRGKWPLREMVRRKGLPAGLLTRRKKGFGAPNADWLRGPLKTWMCDLLSADALKRSGLLAVPPTQRLVNEHLSGKRNHGRALWSLLMLRGWQDRWT